MSRFGEMPPVKSVAGDTLYTIDPVTGEILGREQIVATAVRGEGNIAARQADTSTDVLGVLDDEEDGVDR